MFRRILMRNFQSLAELELTDLGPGLISIDGENEIGKSAFERFLTGLFVGVPATLTKKYVRYGAHSAYLEADLWTGERVEFSFGQEKYLRLYREGQLVSADPDTVRNFLNGHYDKKYKQLLNIRKPKADYIGIDTSPVENYGLLQEVIGTSDLSVRVTQAKSDIGELQDQLKSVVEQQRITNSELENLTAMSWDETATIDQLEERTSRLEMLETAVVLWQETSLLADRPTLPDSLELRERAERVQLLSLAWESAQAVVRWEDRAAGAATLQALLPQYTEAQARYLLLTQALQLSTQLAETDTNMQQAAAALESLDTSMLTARQERLALLNRALELSREVADLEARAAALATTLQEQQVLTSRMEVYRFTCAQLPVLATFKQHNLQLREARGAYEQALQEHDRFMVDNHFCPVVAQTKKCPFSADISTLVM